MYCIKKNAKIFLPLVISAIAFISSQLLLAFARANTKIADSINRGISHGIRRIMAKTSSIVPFSLSELFLILLPIIIFALLTFIIMRICRKRSITVLVSVLLSALLLLFSLKSITVSIGYYSTPLTDIIGISECDITKERLIASLDYTISEINSLSEKADYRDDGTSVGYTLDKLSLLLCNSYDRLSERYDLPEGFFSRIKSVRNGKLMTALGISGIYTYYTGEANIDPLLANPEIIFSAAHELSHQRGVMREDEANFMAFLITTSSNDDYIRYCGYLSMYQYLSSSIYRIDRRAYLAISEKLCSGAKNDIRASYNVINKYSDSRITEFSRSVNDMFLKSHGTDGIEAYGKVTRLAISYYYTMKAVD